MSETSVRRIAVRFIKFGDMLVDPPKVISYSLTGTLNLVFVGGFEYGAELDESRDAEIDEAIEQLLATGLFVKVTPEGGFVNRLAVVAVGEVGPWFDIVLTNGERYEVAGYDDKEEAAIHQSLVDGE